MKFPIIAWKVERTRSLPILNMTGIGNCIECERIMLDMALKMVKKAEGLNGFPCAIQTVPKHQEKSAIIFYFSLVFQSREEMEQFAESIKKGI